MSGLILKLRPREEILINGAVIENGDYKTRLRIKSESVNILRLRKAITAQDATTPLKQAYFIAQCVVSGELAPATAHDQIENSLKQVKTPPDNGPILLQRIENCWRAGDFYSAMRTIGELMNLCGESLPTRPSADKERH